MNMPPVPPPKPRTNHDEGNHDYYSHITRLAIPFFCLYPLIYFSFLPFYKDFSRFFIIFE